ncbi:MAG: hypothetical protein E6I76_05425 [Chloroflexi bacterium]|nr:MAG: hypothetical protein E6I76_05425 [Chloroflexota bacterium]
MHETAGPDPASPVTEPPPLALAIGLELVTRYHLRLTDPRDARLGELGGPYPFGAAAWTPTTPRRRRVTSRSGAPRRCAGARRG